MSVENLPRLVDLSIGVPDGVINCNQLYKLLHLLVRGVRDIEEALGASDESVEDGGLSGPEGKARFDEICDTFKRHSEMLQSLDDQLKALEERLKKCCEQGQTVEELNNLLAENEERTKEAIAGLEEQLKASQEAVDSRLKLLEEMMANLQRTVEEVKENSERNMEDQNRLLELANNCQLVTDLSNQLEALKAQMEGLIQQNEQMSEMINNLVDDKNEMNAKMDQLCAEKDQLNALVDTLADKVGIGGGQPVESAGTTHQVLKDLSCIACDTDVVQRDRDDLPVAAPGKGKPKKIVRKLPKSEALTRIRAKRAAGGSFTVTKPDERILRAVSKDPCASSTTSSSSHRDEKF